MYYRRKPRWRKVVGIIILTILVIMIGATWLQNNQDYLVDLDNQVEQVVDIPVTPVTEMVVQDVQAYFPAIPAMTYNFAGEGMEYADFVRKVTFIDGDYIQLADETTATTGGFVYELDSERITLIMAEPEEHDSTVNFLEALDEDDESNTIAEVIIQSPIAVGQSWETAGKQREIVAIDQEETVPAGTFADVIVIQVSTLDPEQEHVTYEYYAKNIGLIKREFRANPDEDGIPVSSFLESFGNIPY